MTLDSEVIIVGAGISGIGMAISLKQKGFKSILILDKKDSLGGSWLSHQYPGVETDVLAYAYAYSFAPNPNWSTLYPKGDEILAYLKHCAHEYQVYQHMHFNTEVIKACFNANHDYWTLTLHNGLTLKTCFLISATSIFNHCNTPTIKGFNDFKGKVLWPTNWDHEYSLENKRVAVIGTGASAIQIIPSIVDKVKTMQVYQRTPNWVFKKYNPTISSYTQWLLKKRPSLYQLFRFCSNVLSDFLYFGYIYNKHLPLINRLNEKMAHYFLKTNVEDNATRKKLNPDYQLGCKRPLVSNTYLSTFNQKHVKLITTAIKVITTDSIITEDGQSRPVDAIICATGFNIFKPGNYPGFSVYGLKALSLETFWQTHHYQAYSGIALPDFPNFFMTSGPYSLGFSWFAMIEPNIKLITRCLIQARHKKARFIAVKKVAHQKYHDKILKKSKRTAFKHASCVKVNSYFQDPNGNASLSSPVLPFYRKCFSLFSSLKAFDFKRHSPCTAPPKTLFKNLSQSPESEKVL